MKLPYIEKGKDVEVIDFCRFFLNTRLIIEEKRNQVIYGVKVLKALK